MLVKSKVFKDFCLGERCGPLAKQVMPEGIIITPRANWQVLQPVNSFHASGASAVFDDVNSRFIVAFGNARQYGVDGGTNSVNVIEFK